MKTLKSVKNAGLLSAEKVCFVTMYAANKLAEVSANGAVMCRSTRKEISAEQAANELKDSVSNVDTSILNLINKFRKTPIESAGTSWEPKICG